MPEVSIPEVVAAAASEVGVTRPMSVYVDDMNAQFGRMRMCHMFADTHAELVRMAGLIELAGRHIQNPGTSREHFDVCRSKRALAVENGAKEVTMRELALWFRRNREHRGLD